MAPHREPVGRASLGKGTSATQIELTRLLEESGTDQAHEENTVASPSQAASRPASGTHPGKHTSTSKTRTTTSSTSRAPSSSLQDSPDAELPHPSSFLLSDGPSSPQLFSHPPNPSISPLLFNTSASLPSLPSVLPPPSRSTMASQRRGHKKGEESVELVAPTETDSSRRSSLNPSRSGSGHICTPSFSLDSPVPSGAASVGHRRHQSLSVTSFDRIDDHGSGGEGESRGFMDLSAKDKRSFLLLCLLYFLQGAPMGFVGSAIPLLPEFRMDYSKLGILSLAMYPYSVKLLWSPIVDAVYNRSLGRRKSWILPVQTISGLGLLWLGSNITSMVEAVHQGGAGIWGFTAWWILLVFLCATQDIAVDGWAISLLPAENVSYASTAQTVGLTAGQFLCSTVFIPFSSADFANKWFRTVPQDTGLITLGGALKTTGWIYLAVTIGLALFKREDPTKGTVSIKEVYKVMVGILRLRDVQTVLIVHLLAKIGFIANDAVTALKLREKGMSQDDIALMMLIDFPFEVGLGYYAGKWSQELTPMRVWSRAFVGRLVAALFAQFVVSIFPSGGVTTWYLVITIFQHVLSTFMSTIMFVAVSAFHAQIADPEYGGTYMTLLATFSNLGGTFPRYFVLKSIDLFTKASCVPSPSATPEQHKSLLALPETLPCVLEQEKKVCFQAGGMCSISRDGYNWVNLACVIFGAIAFWRWIRPTVATLQKRPLVSWRLPPGRI